MISKWKISEPNLIKSRNLSESLEVSLEIAKLLILRNIETFSQAKSFFRPQLNNMHDPFKMKGMQTAVDRIILAIQKKQKVLIYGDYDVDGTTAVSLVFEFFRDKILDIDYYIPDRYAEGYGVSMASIDYAKKNNYSLIIALDCGIRAVEQVDYAHKKNIDFIICDHHNPGDQLPLAIAILNPKQADCTYPFKELSGCGVGFKLVQAYCISQNIDLDSTIHLLDLLAISIAADIVPINGENRTLMFFGLKQLNSKPRPGLLALINIAEKKNEIKISDILFGIAPLINAAGRIIHGKKAVQVLIEKKISQANIYAKEIKENNNTRKELDKSITEEAIKKIDSQKKSTVLYSSKWHKGVVGIVASRVIEKFYKPTIILVEKDGMLTGSARSVHDFDIYQAINECAYLCEKFGGHKYAAGLSIKKENIEAFILKFEEVVSRDIKDDQLNMKFNIDLEISLAQINNKFFRLIKQFAPFGPINPNPKFISKNVHLNSCRAIGQDKSHLKCIASDNLGFQIEAIGFGLATKLPLLNNSLTVSICYGITENIWNGKTTNQIIIYDIRI